MDKQGKVAFSGDVQVRKIRARERGVVRLSLWELKVTRSLKLTDKDVKGTPLVAGALYLEGHPVQVRPAEAQALLDGWPEHFEVVTRPDDDEEESE